MEESWGLWTTRFWINTEAALDIGNADASLRPLWLLMLNLSKSVVKHHCILYTSIEEGEASTTAGMAVFPYDLHLGLRPVQDELRYRLVLQLSGETFAGKHSRNWLRGCLDKRDVIEGDKNEVALRDPSEWHRALLAFQGERGADIPLRFLKRPFEDGGKTLSAGRPISHFYNPKAVNAHAITRVRYRTQSGSINVHNQIFGAVSGMTQEYQLILGRVREQTSHTYSDVWYRVVAAIGAVKGTYKSIRSYMEDANQDENDGKVPPKTRFGVTAEKILSIWEKEGDESERQLNELLKKHKPYTDPFSGDEFVKVEDMEPYLDLLLAELQKITGTVYFDAYNPRAYVEQKPKHGTNLLPDAVIMKM